MPVHMPIYLILCSSPYGKKKPYNNINIWRYRHKGGDISASTWRQACSYAVARRAGEAEKAEYDLESCSHIASRSRNRPIPKYCVIVWGPKAERSASKVRECSQRRQRLGERAFNVKPIQKPFLVAAR